ncbi:MAG: PorT family protein [Cyclobacteriaceae bacterium]|nr:PorT family protein [Cyclobacteriaceae bacterium]
MITLQKKTLFLFLLFACSSISIAVLAQESTPKNTKATRAGKLVSEKAGRPDVPGDLMIEIGFTWMNDHPVGHGFKTMASRTFNAYYLYDKPIGESAFSFHPGIGVGTEKYAFDKNSTLGYGLDDNGSKVVQFIDLEDIYGQGIAYRKSQINANYLDIPLEIRWISRKYDPKRSLTVTIGGKAGILFDAKTKVKYLEDGEKKITKQKENFELNPFRYGAYAKLGFGGFSAYYYYSFSTTFKKDKGPLATTMFPMTIGLSLALF